ncbi:MAG: 3-dehydroquinate synthase [Desulfuromonas sp.]|nr:MAG: 3-dehydroquinate synthase [Desulfuromonas sp.]
MKELQVGLGERGYSILIDSGLLGCAGEYVKRAGLPRKLALISNPTVANLYSDRVVQSLSDTGFNVDLIEIPDGETYKSLETFEAVIRQLIEKHYDRNCGLVALGGGVVGDLTGFVAATYLRGVPFVQVPTTLLAQVDSSVGGKTAVNHPLGKNLIGAFYQPKLVLIDVATLKTLPEREYRAGIAEIIKYGVIRDADFFAWLETHVSALLDLIPDALAHVVERSCQIKADIVETDEKETSLRAILNFGHTFGHAVETVSGYGTYLHGEAVAVGMVVAALMSHMAGHCSPADVRRIYDLLKAYGLPTLPPDHALDDYLAAMKRDKKVMSGALRMIFNNGIGDCCIQPVDNLENILPAALENAAGL